MTFSLGCFPRRAASDVDPILLRRIQAGTGARVDPRLARQLICRVCASDLVGHRVRIARLEGRPELNGTHGCGTAGPRGRTAHARLRAPHARCARRARRWARSYDATKGRYMVEVQDGGGRQLALRPENLVAEEGLHKEDFMRAVDAG